MDWKKAKEIMNYNYRKFEQLRANYQLLKIDALFDRFDSGERTEYLYNEILKLDFQPEEYGY